MSEQLVLVLGAIGVVLVVAIVWLVRRTLERRLSTTPTVPLASVMDVAGPEIADLLLKGNKIQAIKRVRDLSGVGLKEAKDYVDRLVAGQAQPLRSIASHTGAQVNGLDHVEMQIRPLLEQGNVIEGIRQVRVQTGMNLKDAKHYVDSLRSEA